MKLDNSKNIRETIDKLNQQLRENNYNLGGSCYGDINSENHKKVRTIYKYRYLIDKISYVHLLGNPYTLVAFKDKNIQEVKLKNLINPQYFVERDINLLNNVDFNFIEPNYK